VSARNLAYPRKARQGGFFALPGGMGFLKPSGALPTPEPTWANVSLLVHGDSRPFIDVSANQHALCNWAGRVTLSSAAATFAASATSGLKTPSHHTSWIFGTGAWMVAAYVVTNASNNPRARIVETRATTSSNDGFAFAVDANRRPYVEVMGINYGVGGTGLPTASVLVPNATRTHVAVSYDATTLRCFVDGVLSWSHAVALNISGNNSLVIGNTADLANGVPSQRLDEIIVVKGEAVYTSNFTPPARYSDTGIVLAQAAAPTFSNVKLLIHGAGANGGTTITDSSSSARTVSRFGNLQTSTAQARIGSSSLLFDGTGDYATVPASSDFAFPGDFCTEALAYTDVSTLRAMLSSYATGQGWHLQTGATGGLAVAGGAQFGHGDATTRVNTIDALIPTLAWFHIAVSRSGTVMMMFVEGEFIHYLSNSTSISNTVALHIGRFAAATTTRDWDGYMQEIRVTKGEPVYTRSFAVQTAAHPNS
jgi:hypothetical protein